MSNDVQSHETVAERAAAGDRRTSGRHAAATLGAVQARLIGGSKVDLVNFSNRGVLFECDSRLLIGARASVRITSPEHNLVVTGRVVRSRVKGLVNGALRYDAALALDHEFALTPALVELMARLGAHATDEFDGGPDREPVEEYLAESEASLAEAVRERDAGGSADTPAEQAAADEEPAALEDDGEIAFEPAIEFAIEPAVEFAFDGGSEAAFEDAAPGAYDPATTAHEPPAAAVDGDVAASEPVASVSFFDPTPRGMQDRGVTFDDAPADDERTAGDEPVALLDVAAHGAGDAVEAAVVFEAEEAVDFEPAFDAAGVLPDAPAAEVIASDSLVASEPAVVPELTALTHPTDLPPDLPAELPPDLPPVLSADLSPDLAPGPAADAGPESSPEHPSTTLDLDDRVLQQFVASVPPDLADLRRIAADNQW